MKRERTIHLTDLRVGESAEIVAFVHSEQAAGYRHKLLSMGLLPGTSIRLVRVAPLGDPIQISCRGTLLSLRAEEASLIELTREPAYA